MSPIDENELRDELWFAEPASGPHPDALGAAVVARGRAVRRRRLATASVAGVAIVALAGAGIWSVLPRTHQDAVPAQTPTASATPTPSATSTPSAGPSTSGVGPWTDTRMLPASYGDLADFTLLDDGKDWPSNNSAVFRCENGSEDFGSFDALTDLEAARRIDSPSEGEGGNWEAILVFRSEASARGFLTQLRAAVAECEAKPLPTANPPGYPRWVRTSTVYEAGDEGFVFGSYGELYMDGEWKAVPGGDMEMWSRRGRAITMSGAGGEFVGDIFTLRPDVVADLRGAVDHALPQMCRWTAGGC